MFKRKKDDPEISYSEAMEKIEASRPKTRITTRIYFWFFIVFMVLGLFMFWFNKGNNTSTINIIIGIVAICLSVLFGLLSLVRFIRARSITGGLFLTTCIATGVFLGVSQMLPVIVPPTAAAFSNAPEATNNGLQLMVALAQVGLFALWFVFLLFTIYLHVKPVKRIDKYLTKILEGDEIKKVKIGHAKQYKVIEEKLSYISRRPTRKSKSSARKNPA